LPWVLALRRPGEKRRETGEQYGTSPEAVGYRTVDKLPGANPGEIKAHNELHMRRRVGEDCDEQRQSRHDPFRHSRKLRSADMVAGTPV
jgi:hypothetical protein